MQTGSFIARAVLARRSALAGVALVAAGAAWAEDSVDAGDAPAAGVGLRLDSGKTMTMRIKGGGLGLYLRSKF